MRFSRPYCRVWRLRLGTSAVRFRSTRRWFFPCGTAPSPSGANLRRRGSPACWLASIRILTTPRLSTERLRRALEKFFDWHCAWPPDECADETLDRLVVKLADVNVEDVRAYARGIARLVLLEWRRRPAAVPMDESRDYAAVLSPTHEDDTEALSSCFERCLAALSDETRSLVLDYYVAERRAKIDNRRRLALSLGLSESALRNRVQRVRNRLERCVQTCTATATAIGLEAAMKEAD